MRHTHTILLIIALLLPIGVMAQETFTLPEVPKILKTPTERANYLALHYWDNYDFTNVALIGNEDISEQGFSNFISIMPYVTEKEAAFEQLAKRMSENEKMLRYFMGIGDKYLSSPHSPVYNEELYILMLEKVVALPQIAKKDKENYTFDLKMAKKNRVGSIATDFEFLERDGKHRRLSEVKGEYLLLFFGDPECDVCVDTKEQLLASPLFRKYTANGRLKVVYICVEGKTNAWKKTPAPEGWIDACDEKEAIYDKQLYNLPGLPILYLLDENQRIMMKEIHHEHLLSFLTKL